MTRTAELPEAPVGRALNRERAALLALTAFVLLLTLVPPTLARIYGPADRVHIGTYWFAWDFGQYFAAMREGASSASWLVHNHFSAEPHEPALMYSLFVAIGKIASATGLPLMGVYGAVELATRLLLPASMYFFAATFVREPRGRILAVVLTMFGGGLALWLGLLSYGLGLAQSAVGEPQRPSNPYVEVTTFGAFLAAPHLGLGLAATLTSAAAFARALMGWAWGAPVVAASIAALSLIHPFNLPALLGAMGLYAGFALVKRWPTARPALTASLAAVVAGAPMLLYSFLTFNLSPFWSATYGAQNELPSPEPWLLPMAFGVVLLLAFAGAYSLRKSPTVPQIFLLLWIAATMLFMWAPVPYQRRFAFGLQPALAVLAAVGWPVWCDWVARAIQRLQPTKHRPALARRLALYLLLLFGFTDVLVAYLAVLSSATLNQPVPVYGMDRDTYGVGQWIAQRGGPDDVVLCAPATGNMLAGELPGRVAAAISTATLRMREKGATIRAMYRGELPEGDVRTFLAQNRVSYLLVGDEERKLGDHDPGAALHLPIAVRIGSATAYRVTPADWARG